MKNQLIANLFAASDMALCPTNAQNLLSQPLPDMAAEAVTSAAMMARGERFAVSRGVAVVPIRGILTPNMFMFERYMGWATYQGLEDTFGMLAANEEVAAIVPIFDTPGGMIIGLEGAAGAIAAAAKIKPVHALVHPLCASAGYWLASQASDIAATPGSLVGSIGTMRSGSSPVKVGSSGFKYFDMRSSHAAAKNPDPATDDGMAEIQKTLDIAETAFHAAIAAGRNIPLADLPGRLSATDDVKDGGRAYEVADAISRGLVDTAETRDDFYSRIFGKYSPKPRPQRRALSAVAQAQAALSVAKT